MIALKVACLQLKGYVPQLNQLQLFNFANMFAYIAHHWYIGYLGLNLPEPEFLLSCHLMAQLLSAKSASDARFGLANKVCINWIEIMRYSVVLYEVKIFSHYSAVRNFYTMGLVHYSNCFYEYFMPSLFSLTCLALTRPLQKRRWMFCQDKLQIFYPSPQLFGIAAVIWLSLLLSAMLLLLQLLQL